MVDGTRENDKSLYRELKKYQTALLVVGIVAVDLACDVGICVRIAWPARWTRTASTTSVRTGECSGKRSADKAPPVQLGRPVELLRYLRRHLHVPFVAKRSVGISVVYLGPKS